MHIKGLTDRNYFEQDVDSIWNKILNFIEKKSFKELLKQQVFCNFICYAPKSRTIWLEGNKNFSEQIDKHFNLIENSIFSLLGKDCEIIFCYVEPEELKKGKEYKQLLKAWHKSLKEADNNGLNNARTWTDEGEEKIYYWNKLRFRSMAEISIAKELERREITFVPNAACRTGKIENVQESRINIEIDFIVLHKGKIAIIEIDSNTHHPDFYEKDNLRDISFQIQTKFKTYRFHRDYIISKGASWCVETILKLIDS